MPLSVAGPTACCTGAAAIRWTGAGRSGGGGRACLFSWPRKTRQQTRRRAENGLVLRCVRQGLLPCRRKVVLLAWRSPRVPQADPPGGPGGCGPPVGLSVPRDGVASKPLLNVCGVGRLLKSQFRFELVSPASRSPTRSAVRARRGARMRQRVPACHQAVLEIWAACDGPRVAACRGGRAQAVARALHPVYIAASTTAPSNEKYTPDSPTPGVEGHVSDSRRCTHPCRCVTWRRPRPGDGLCASIAGRAVVCCSARTGDLDFGLPTVTECPCRPGGGSATECGHGRARPRQYQEQRRSGRNKPQCSHSALPPLRGAMLLLLVPIVMAPKPGTPGGRGKSVTICDSAAPGRAKPLRRPTQSRVPAAVLRLAGSGPCGSWAGGRAEYSRSMGILLQVGTSGRLGR